MGGDLRRGALLERSLSSAGPPTGGGGGDGGGRPLPRGCGTGPKCPRSPSGPRRGPRNSEAQRAGGEVGAVPRPVGSCWRGSAGARIAVCASSPALGVLPKPSVSNAPQPSVTDEAAPARLPAVTRSAEPHLPHRREPHQKPGGTRRAAQEGRDAQQPQGGMSVPESSAFFSPQIGRCVGLPGRGRGTSAARGTGPSRAVGASGAVPGTAEQGQPLRTDRSSVRAVRSIRTAVPAPARAAGNAGDSDGSAQSGREGRRLTWKGRSCSLLVFADALQGHIYTFNRQI